MEINDWISVGFSSLSLLISVYNVISNKVLKKENKKLTNLPKIHAVLQNIDQAFKVRQLDSYSELTDSTSKKNKEIKKSISDTQEILNTSITGQPFSKETQDKIRAFNSSVSSYVYAASMYALCKETGREEKRMELAPKKDEAINNLENNYIGIKEDLNDLLNKNKKS